MARAHLARLIAVYLGCVDHVAAIKGDVASSTALNSLLRRESDSSEGPIREVDQQPISTDAKAMAIVNRIMDPASAIRNSMGMADCPCIPIFDTKVRQLKDGSGVLVNIDGSQVVYPLGVGQTCEAWDDKTSKDCVGDAGDPRCRQKWCFVDPCKCSAVPEPLESDYMPDVRYQGRPLFMSFETCDAQALSSFLKQPTLQRSCNMQDNEVTCVSVDICSWTGGACVRKEKADLCPTRTVTGSNSCPCMKIEDFGEGEEAKQSTANVVFTAAEKDYGSQCKAWDKDFNPTLCSAGTNGAESCEAEWCYVDPCQCDLSITLLSRTKHLGLKAGKELYMSYATCGSEFKKSIQLDSVPDRTALADSCPKGKGDANEAEEIKQQEAADKRDALNDKVLGGKKGTKQDVEGSMKPKSVNSASDGEPIKSAPQDGLPDADGVKSADGLMTVPAFEGQFLNCSAVWNVSGLACEEGTSIQEYSWCTPRCEINKLPIVDVRDTTQVHACSGIEGGQWGSHLCCLGGQLYPPTFSCTGDLFDLADSDKSGELSRTEFDVEKLKEDGKVEEALEFAKAEAALEKTISAQSSRSGWWKGRKGEYKDEEGSPIVFWWIFTLMVVTVVAAFYTIYWVFTMHQSLEKPPEASTSGSYSVSDSNSSEKK